MRRLSRSSPSRRATVLARRRAAGERLAVSEPQTQTIVVAASDYRVALGGARHRQVDRHRFSARHQGRAGGRSQDRQRRRSAPRAAPTSSATTSEQTNIVFFDAEGKQMAGFDIAVTPRSRAASARRSGKLLPGCRHQRRRHRRRHHSDRHGVEPGRGAAGLRHRQPRGDSGGGGRRHYGCRRREQGRQRHRGARPRPDHAESDGRRGRARHHQAARHQSVRLRSATAPPSSISTTIRQSSSPRLFAPDSLSGRQQSPAGGFNGHRPRCRPWSRPASSARSPSRP